MGRGLNQVDQFQPHKRQGLDTLLCVVIL